MKVIKKTVAQKAFCEAAIEDKNRCPCMLETSPIATEPNHIRAHTCNRPTDRPTEQPTNNQTNVKQKQMIGMCV